MAANISQDYPHWEKLMNLLDDARDESTGVRALLRDPDPLVVKQRLEADYGITEEDLGKFLEDDWYLGKERNDKFWRW